MSSLGKPQLNHADLRILKDGEGNELPVTDLDGRYLIPSVSRQYWENTMKIKARDDDIYITDYPKSGLHWLQEIVRRLVNHPPEISAESGFIDVGFVPLESLDKLPSPRIITSHRLFRELPPDAIQRRCKVLYIERNFKGVAWSFYNFMCNVGMINYKGKWPAFAELFLKGEVGYNSWFDTVKDWRKIMKENPDYPIHFITYEKLKADPQGEITRLAHFLGVKADPALIKDVAEKTEFNTMKAAKENEAKERLPGLFKGDQNHVYRKGEVADWKNWFTVAQSEMYDAEYAKQMGQAPDEEE